MFKVLHLDDELEIREVFSDLFSSDRIRIVSLATAEEALAALANDPPDLIFLDYRLPGTTGEEVACELNTEVPICLITGDTAVKVSFKFAAVFKKPWSTREIQDFLDKCIEEKNQKSNR